jgi:DNA-binding Lrp family transcriptional regulator
MVTSIVLINVERAKLKDVVNELVNLEGITEVHAVAGEYDLVVIARVADNKKLSEIVVEKMPHEIPGIIHTKTLFALDTQSKFDLKSLFNI